MAKSQWLHIVTILIVAITIFFTSLGKSRLWDRDEPRNAGCAAEMLERSEFVVPIFNDELRHQKPVLLYWLMMSAYTVFGVTEFAARFWSAALAVGTALLTYGIARRLFDASVAWLASIALCSSIMFCVAARAATPDSVLIFFSTLGIYFYVIGTFAASKTDGIKLKTEGHWFPQQYLFVVLMNVAFAFAVLAKGPVGIVIPTAIIGMFLLLQRLPAINANEVRAGRFSRLCQWLLHLLNPVHFLRTCWAMRPMTAIGIVLLIAAPWYVLVGLQTQGQFTQLFFLNENFARATTVMESHSGSWLFYPAAIAIGFFPWSIFLGPVVLAADQHLSSNSNESAAIKLLACWVLVQVGLFSIAETKLPSYVTPCYPALAILTSFCVLRWLPSAATGRGWQIAASSTFVLAGVIALVGLGIASNQYFEQIWWIALLGMIPIVGGAVAIFLIRADRQTSASLATTVAAVLFCLFLFGVGTVAVDSTRQTELLLDQVKSSDDSTSVATYRCLESSWVFYSKRPIYELNQSNAKNDIASLDRQNFWEKKAIVNPQTFVAERPNSVFLTTDEHASELLQQLPENFQIQQEVDFFLKPDRKLVLIGSEHPAVADSDADQTTVR